MSDLIIHLTAFICIDNYTYMYVVGCISKRFKTSSVQVFDIDLLSNPHYAVGNGQHVGCAGLAILAALASIELFPEVAPAPPLDANVKTIGPSADGRCFFSCCYLWCSTNSEKRTWAEVERNGVGFPLDAERLKVEAMEWVL